MLVENESSYEQKLISKTQYFKKQFELLDEMQREMDRLERLDFGIFKLIKRWLDMIFKSKN